MLALLLLACSGGDAPPSADPLGGTWRFEEECGSTTGGSAVVVGYTLTVTGDQATLDADGNQTMLRARGTVRALDDGGWDLVFDSPGDGGAFSELYRPGDLLLNLHLRDGVLEATPGKLNIQCSAQLRFERG